MRLQVACRYLAPSDARSKGGGVWLVGATHLGERRYYDDLQRLLDAQPLVLFEGVGATNKQFQIRNASDFSLQESLAHALGLEFQLNAIDYSKPHFHNSDLSLAQLTKLFQPPEPKPQAAGDGTHAEPASAPGANAGQGFAQLVQVMEGSGILGAVARFGVGIIAASPRLQATTKVGLMEMLDQLSGDFQRWPGMPKDFQDLLKVLIEERNKTVVHDVSNALRASPAPSAIAVFYGAGHMPDLEVRLCTQLGYRTAKEQWLTAFEVNPLTSGLSAVELDFMRRWIRMELNVLQQTNTSAEK